MEIHRLTIAIAIAVHAILGLTGCGSGGTDCNSVGDQNFNGQWIQLQSSTGQQKVSIHYGWSTGGRPTSSYWGVVEKSLKAGFTFAGHEVLGTIAEGVVKGAQDLFDRPQDAQEGSAVAETTFDTPGMIWQWEWNNGEACKGTTLKTKDFRLTPMGTSNYPPCCLPDQFVSDDPHGECHPNTPVSDHTHCKIPASHVLMETCTNKDSQTFNMDIDGRITLKSNAKLCLTEGALIKDHTIAGIARWLEVQACNPSKDDKQRFVLHRDDSTLRLKFNDSRASCLDAWREHEEVNVYFCYHPLHQNQQFVYDPMHGTFTARDDSKTCMTANVSTWMTWNSTSSLREHTELVV